MPDIPFEPSGDARNMAGILRNWYVALVDAGFSENQAMSFIQQMLATATQKGMD